MRPSTATSRRAATAIATLGLASLVTLAPAQARTDPGTPLPSAGTPADSSRFDNDRSGSTALSGSARHRGVGATTEENRVSREQIAPKSEAPGPTTMIRVDDDAVEYLQIGLGALAGVALFGATAAAVSASHRRHAAHPA